MVSFVKIVFRVVRNLKEPKLTMFNDIPGQLTTKILIGLHVKDLIRSSGVNKLLYSLINNPEFISAQSSMLHPSVITIMY